MKKEISAGGVVVVGNAILLLRKYNGDWVLPKGRMKRGEALTDTALREVQEETGVKGEIVSYLGNVTYYLNGRSVNREKTQKTVHWYYMKARNMDCTPQRSEGFVEAKYVLIDRAIQLVRYDDERKIITLAAEIYEKEQRKEHAAEK